MIARSTCLLAFLPLQLGCGAAPSPSATAVLRPAAQREAGSAPAANRREIQRAGQAPALPRLTADQSYGVWLADDDSCWLHLEKPRVRIVAVNREKQTGWLCNGYYAFARDGSVFGCIHEFGQIAADALTDLCWSNESSLRGLPMRKEARPFHCELRADGDSLKVLDFRGPTWHGDGDRWHGRSYRKVALARPGHSGTLPPVGNWERRPPETRDRVALSILPEQIGVTIVDGAAGRRMRLQGECAAASDGLLYGMFLTVDHALGSEKPEPLSPAPLFCLRLGSTSNRLQVRSLESLDLDEATRARLQGEYRPD